VCAELLLHTLRPTWLLTASGSGTTLCVNHPTSGSGTRQDNSHEFTSECVLLDCFAIVAEPLRDAIKSFLWC